MRGIPRRFFLILCLLYGLPALAVGPDCPCDHSAPVTFENRVCGLCQEAEKLLASGAAQTGELPVGFIKDASPRKPNRTLALPLDRHGRGMQELADLNAAERASLWGAAIRKAQELWPGVWGLAVNSPGVRSQCHLHVHIGKLNDGVEDDDGVAVSAPEEIPLPLPGMGIWIHPVAQGWHVHAGREAPELVLMR